MSEISYLIHPQATQNRSCLVLTLAEVEKEGYSFRIINPPDGYLVPKWRSLAKSSSDKEFFAFILKEELAYQQKKTGKTPHIETLVLKEVHISPLQIETALKLLAPSQKLFLNSKQLIVDLFGKTEFYYLGHPQNTELEIEGRLRWRDTDIALTECEVIGPGKPYHWFVRGLTLKFIHTDVSWKQLQELREGKIRLSGGIKQTFLDAIDSKDPDCPNLVIKEGTLEEAHQAAIPYPVLKLKDRWGTCADLWMDYGEGHLIPLQDQRLIMKDEKGGLLFKRQFEEESKWEKDLLETDYIKKIVSSSHYYCPLDKVGKSLAFLLEVGWHIRDVQDRQVVKQTEIDLNLHDEMQFIGVKGRVRYDTYEADLSNIVGAFNRRDIFVQLNPSTVGLLSMNGPLQTLQDLAQEGEFVSNEVRIKKNRFGALESLWQCAKSSPSLLSLKEKWQNFKGIQEAFPSPDFHGNLRPYQQEGVNWLAFLHEYGFHGILADEMGLGKTVQILAFLSRLPKNQPHLIVMPTSLLFNWKNEILRFLPQYHCYIHQGPDRIRISDDLKKVNIILTSYTTLRLDLPLFLSLNYTSLILDEAQMIKNAQTQTAIAVCQLRADLKLCLTGTPIENHLRELWSHFHFLIPDLLGSQEQFEADILASQSDRRYIERIKKKITPFLLRRRKKDVASDLPPRSDQTVWIEMSEEQRSVYDHLLAGFKSGLLKKVESEGMGKHRMEVLEAILRLRQVCCHPLLVSSLIEDSIPSSAKFESLIQDLETLVEEGNKVLIYSQFTSMLQLMTKTAKEKNWSYGYLDGSTKNREDVVTRFQEDPTQLLFFISLKAGGVGLNLTAADYVYLYDPWWNEAVEEQAINRAHRIGRQEGIIAKRFVVAESIEEKMMKLKASKRLIIDDLLEGDASQNQLTLEDLQFLLS